MPTQKITFPGSQQAMLAGRLDTPDHNPRAWSIFAHCFTCSKDSKAAAYISRALARAGFGVLRFDFTGLGGSGGDFANTHFSSNVAQSGFRSMRRCRRLRAHIATPGLIDGAHQLADTAATSGISRRQYSWHPN